MSKRTCTIEGCEKRINARGWCNTHYERWRRHGSTDDPTPTAQERFQRYVDRTDGCWLWTGLQDRHGYGRFYSGERMMGAHHFSWVAERGPVPDGLELDHLCRTPRCVNPDHLEPVTHAENVRRGRAGARKREIAAASKTCQKGHTRTDANTYVSPDGRRHCRDCRKERLSCR